MQFFQVCCIGLSFCDGGKECISWVRIKTQNHKIKLHNRLLFEINYITFYYQSKFYRKWKVELLEGSVWSVLARLEPTRSWGKILGNQVKISPPQPDLKTTFIYKIFGYIQKFWMSWNFLQAKYSTIQTDPKTS